MDGDCAWIGGCICDFFFSWHHRSYIVVVRGLWPHRGWSIFWPPPAPLSFGDGPYSPTLFRPTDHATCRTDPLAQSHRLYLSFKYMLDVKGQLDTLLAKEKAPVFIIRNICVVIPCAVIALSTGNRISPRLYRVSSPPASQDIYCYCHNDLIEAKEPFVGLELFALQIRAPVQGWLHLTRDFQGLLQLSNIGWCQVNMTLTLGKYIIF